MSSDIPHIETPAFDHSSLDPTTSTEQNDGYLNGTLNQENLNKAKQTVLSSAQQATETIKNHPATQNVMDAVNNAPVAQVAKEQSQITSNEFRDLMDSRTIPDAPAATGQPLTHYHSMFYRLLSWKNPRATSISFVASILFIFAARYLPILRWFFRISYLVFGITAAAELAGSLAFGKGLTTQIRPKKYFTIPKESLERFLDDFEQLINFFVIEFQRVVFAENVYVTGAAFFGAFLSYYLIKVVPLWGLSLIGTSIVYLGPLIYIKNKDVIDAQLEQGRTIVGQQATQIKDLAAQHTSNASATLKSYTHEYTNKASEYIGNARGRSASPEVNTKDFPIAPKSDPVSEKRTAEEPLITTS
ncbi:cell lysis protein-like protein [Patellaria atrata CBS 101060]|uniref:Reticulon-like protein n=1 Tax=Patellaria atrata CBS 101060 TaxID=1346257 RepID=A0A9P4SEJ6_9PEZI|nr:cell lysis protein-like protein [Patellaria atrata CBS 101060]